MTVLATVSTQAIAGEQALEIARRLAHGIAGPLALMSTCEKAGWSVSGQTSAIHTASHWLLTWQIPDTQTWPPYITGAELDSARPSPALGRRDAWCYKLTELRSVPAVQAALQHRAVQ